MKQVSRIITIILVLVVILSSLFFINKKFFEKSTNKQYNILVVFKTMDKSIEFWQTVRTGIEAAAKEFDVLVTITGVEVESDIQGQIHILEDSIKDKPDAIVLAANDYNALVPVCEEIVKKGIKLICFDSAINSDLANSFIATDNIKAGKQMGETLSKLINSKSKIVIISHVKGSATAIEREKGFKLGLAQNLQDKVIGTYFSNTSEAKAFEIAMDILSKRSDIAGIAGLNEPSTVGAAKAIKQLGLIGKVKLVGFDSSINEIKLIEEGVIQATVVQKPFNMGYLSIKTAVEALKGQKVAKRLDTGSQNITKENMYSIENQKLLFPFGD